MRIENINKGICESRLQQGKPCYFVNYTQDGKNEYKFFSLPWQMYRAYEILQIYALI